METNTKKVTCPKCKIVHEQSGTAIKHGSRYYCPECLPKPKDTTPRCPSCKEPLDMDTAVKRLDKGKEVYYCPRCIEARNREARAHYDLLDYIYQKHGYKEKGIGGEYVAGQIKVIKNMHPHFKETGMLASLKYYYEICGNEIHPNPYKLIPYIYEEAKEFYEHRREITRHYLATLEERKNTPSKPVIVKSEPFKPKLKVKEIDLDSV